MRFTLNIRRLLYISYLQFLLSRPWDPGEGSSFTSELSPVLTILNFMSFIWAYFPLSDILVLMFTFTLTFSANLKIKSKYNTAVQHCVTRYGAGRRSRRFTRAARSSTYNSYSCLNVSMFDFFQALSRLINPYCQVFLHIFVHKKCSAHFRSLSDLPKISR